MERPVVISLESEWTVKNSGMRYSERGLTLSRINALGDTSRFSDRASTYSLLYAGIEYRADSYA